MEKIQLITYEPEDLEEYDSNIYISDFNKLKALDNFEIKNSIIFLVKLIISSFVLFPYGTFFVSPK